MAGENHKQSSMNPSWSGREPSRSHRYSVEWNCFT